MYDEVKADDKFFTFCFCRVYIQYTKPINCFSCLAPSNYLKKESLNKTTLTHAWKALIWDVQPPTLSPNPKPKPLTLIKSNAKHQFYKSVDPN